jgi:thiamine-phosphate pyrophosphorylase
MRTVDYSVYLVTDEACLGGRDLLTCVRQALEGGVTCVQYRAKDAAGTKMYIETLALKHLCDEFDVPLIINDRLDVAQAVGAAGVHLGQGDLPCGVARKILGADFLIGVSAHNVSEALQAVQDGASYLGCGAVFGTTTKADVTALGLDNLRAIRQAVDIPIVGIGGVTAANYALVRQTGADGAAIVSGILAQADVQLAAAHIKEQARRF